MGDGERDALPFWGRLETSIKTRWIFVAASLAFVLGPLAFPVKTQKLYWANSSQIVRANLDGSELEVLVAGSSGPMDIALDIVGDKIYWTDIATDKIQRANLDGAGVADLLSGIHAFGIALDVTGGKMYWTDNLTTKIQRAELNGTNVEDLVVLTGNPVPYSIALDGDGGKMYCTSAGLGFGLFPKIRRANLDGSGVEILVEPAIGPQFGIALDLRAGKMYRTSIQGKIERANLDGSGVETVLDNGLGQPTGIALDLRRSIPTLSEWGLIAMLGLFLAMGTLIIRRRGSVGRDADSDDTSNVLPKGDAQAVRDSINRLWTD